MSIDGLEEVYLWKENEDGTMEKSNEWTSKIDGQEAKGKFFVLKRAPEEGIYMDMLVMMPESFVPDKDVRIALTPCNSGSPSGSVWRPKSYVERDGGRRFKKEPFYKDSYDELTDEDFKKLYPRSSDRLELIFSQLIGTNDILAYPMIFQRAGSPYFQQLTREAVTYDKEDCFKRVDIQVMKAIDKLRGILKDKGIETAENVDLLGQSAAGTFAQCFGMLHSDRVNSICTNGAKDVIPLPVENHKNALLRYPYGIGDIEEFTGLDSKTVAKNLRQIPFVNTYGIGEDIEFFKGFMDFPGGAPPSNYDMTYISCIVPEEHVAGIREIFGHTQNERILCYEGIYTKANSPHLFIGFDSSVERNPTTNEYEQYQYVHGQRKATYRLTNDFLKRVNDKEQRKDPMGIIQSLREGLSNEHSGEHKTNYFDIGKIRENGEQKSFLEFEKGMNALRGINLALWTKERNPSMVKSILEELSGKSREEYSQMVDKIANISEEDLRKIMEQRKMEIQDSQYFKTLR